MSKRSEKNQLSLFTDEQQGYGRTKNGLEYRGIRTTVNKHGETIKLAVVVKPLEKFIEQANAIWHGKYDYTNSRYTNNKAPINIYCPKHDYEFTVGMAQNHLMKHNPTGCPVCSYEKQYGVEYGSEWRNDLEPTPNQNRVRSKANHHNLPPEEKERRKAERAAKFAEARQKRKEERQRAYQERIAAQKAETQRRKEAEKAERERQKQQRIKEFQEMFLREAPKAQGEGYQYRGVENITSKSSRVMVHCGNPDHEWHEMLVWLCLQGSKCRECAGRHVPRAKRADDFLKRAYKKYGTELFDLSRVHAQYINNDTYVEVKCLKHNLWYLVTPDTFIRKAGGCPICNTSKGEMEIILWLREHDVRYEKEPIWTHNNMFCKRNYLKPDFWLPDHNLIIEYNGEQHYENVGLFKRDKNWTLEDQQERDMTIRDLCREKNIRLLEIPYTEFDHIKDILAKNIKLPKK